MAGDGATGPDRVLLALEPGRNRDLLEEWLAGFPDCRVETVDRPGAVPERFDLCVLDRASLEGFRSVLEARREATAPVYLPILLTVSGAGEDATAAARRLEAAAGDLVTDVVALPVEQATLRRRIENLLRARRMSLRLAEREEQYRRLVQLTPEAILLVREGSVVSANDAATELFGGGSTTPEGRSVLEYAPDDAERGRLEALLAEIVERGRHDGFLEYAFETPDGPVETEIAGVRVTFDGEPTTQLVVRDVTERKEREQQLTLFERAIDAAAQGITVADARQGDEPLIYANEAFEEITGYDVGEVLGRNCRFLQGERTDAGTVARLRRAIREQEPVSVEIRNYRKDGTPFWNALDVVPVRDGEGTTTHFVGLQRDVTERREREERLAVLDRVLRHDLRNRVNVIQGHAETVREADDPAVAAAGERIFAAAEKLVGLSDQVRSFRSVVGSEERERTVESERLDLAADIEATTEALEDRYPDLTVDLDLPASVPVLAHGSLPGALRELLELGAQRGRGAARLAVTARSGDDGRWVIELHDHGGTLPHDDLAMTERGEETPLDHALGLEAWLLSWAVEYSGGELVFEPDADPPTVRIHLPRSRPTSGGEGAR